MKKLAVYWSYRMPGKVGLLVEPLVPVLQDLNSRGSGIKSLGVSMYQKCPSYINYFKNTFVVRAASDITIIHDTEGKTISLQGDLGTDPTSVTSIVDAGEYEENYPIMQLTWETLLFTEEDIEVSQIPASMHDNSLLRNSFSVSGSMNISKWFRSMRPAFFMRKGSTIDIRKGDVLYYLKVHTSKPVEIVPFEVTEDIASIVEECATLKNYKCSQPLPRLYKWFVSMNRPAKVLKLIKANLR